MRTAAVGAGYLNNKPSSTWWLQCGAVCGCQCPPCAVCCSCCSCCSLDCYNPNDPSAAQHQPAPAQWAGRHLADARDTVQYSTVQYSTVQWAGRHLADARARSNSCACRLWQPAPSWAPESQLPGHVSHYRHVSYCRHVSHCILRAQPPSQPGHLVFCPPKLRLRRD